ncbi:MAG: 4-hydroxy-tetrahydrodipicolinate reductase [Lentisphaerae bacterium]|nr:4-hydroxy-tetrahydrodipicolinate reductase [Lentisphaerota bacterium]
MSDTLTRIAVLGAAGRMGKMLVRGAVGMEGISLVAAIEQEGHADIGLDAGDIAGIGSCDVRVTDRADEATRAADVLIDFTFHTAAPEHAALASRHGKAIVIGTTGLDATEASAVQKAAESIPVVWAPNMSLGMNVLFAAVEKAAAIFGLTYRAELDETHHVHKKDSPSGTALRLAEKVASGRGQDLATVMRHDPPTEEVAAGSIVVRSHREGEVVGNHTVAFESGAERIEFTHHAWSRDAFALGALHAASWVAGKTPGLYDMQDVLEL